MWLRNEYMKECGILDKKLMTPRADVWLRKVDMCIRQSKQRIPSV